MDNTAVYFKYWGKVGRDGHDESSYHLLPYHSLDVAAVGEQLLRQHNNLRKTLSKLTGLSESALQASLPALLTLHDLGKFSNTFQALRLDIQQILSPNIESSNDYNIRHDQLGYLFWKNILKPHWQEKNILPRAGRRGSGSHPIDFCMLAMTGHHGKPPSAAQQSHQRYFSEQDQKAANDFADDILTLFPNFAHTLNQWDKHATQKASWWLAGFAVLCDWIGSNADWFSYQEKPQALSDYWLKAQKKAKTAINNTELLSATPSQSLTLSQLINLKKEDQATPLQDKVTELPLNQHPQLFILEDVTGAGKTEAALLLSHRLMSNSLANGLYFGLPTMATANAMYERVGDIYQQFYTTEIAPSLVLAHGARELSKGFRQSLIPDHLKIEKSYAADEAPPASTHCSEWLADNRKKALLAEVGIGTIDQALLAVLPNKHQSLRLLGLANKVLIVDEVHAYDAYMQKLLETLLTSHAMAGGSAILLSATLPENNRQRLIKAFAQGLGQQAPNIINNNYPLLSHYNGQQLNEYPIATRPEVARRVSVDFQHQQQLINQKIEQWLQQGQCVCWICNTVKDAREIYTQLKEQHPEWSINLFHARFCLADRLAIETQVLNQFGKKSTPAQRHGQLLIATQVVEQSLDLDFDQLITDLAPIDLIIQRAGRLHRHRRDQKGNIINRTDERPDPVLTIHSPEWQVEPRNDWYEVKFPNAQAVYDNHAQLWLGMKLLKEKKGFRMPDDARNLIEGVYSNSNDIPEGLEQRDIDAEGKRNAQQGMAHLNQLYLEGGYSIEHSANWWDESNTPTRLQEIETTQVWLAKWDEGKLRPLHDEDRFAWQKSSLSISSHNVEACTPHSDIPNDILEICTNSLPAKGKWGILIILEQQLNNMWQSVNTKETLYYNNRLGLLTQKDINSNKDMQHEST